MSHGEKPVSRGPSWSQLQFPAAASCLGFPPFSPKLLLTPVFIRAQEKKLEEVSSLHCHFYQGRWQNTQQDPANEGGLYSCSQFPESWGENSWSSSPHGLKLWG